MERQFYGGRKVWFDPKSLNYKIRSRVYGLDPKTSYWPCTTIFDQVDGSCVGMSLGGELVAEPVPCTWVDYAYAYGIYQAAQLADPFPDTPPKQGTTIIAGLQICKERGFYTGYYWGLTLEDYILGIANYGPAVLGVAWWAAMNTPTVEGFIVPAGAILGGHAILCNGVNVEEKYFTVHNSWGPDWGGRGGCKPGEAKIKFEHMEILRTVDGECAFVEGRKDISQPEPEPPEPEPPEPEPPEPEPENGICKFAKKYVQFGNAVSKLMGSNIRVSAKRG